MKRLYILFSLLVFVSVFTVFAQENTLDEAAIAYDEGDYYTAIVIYEQLLEDNPTNRDLLYNLGTAYLASGDLGRAMFYYRTAYELMPRDNALNEAIAKLRAQRTDIQGDETDLIDNFAAMTSGMFTPNELITMVFIGWVLWFTVLLFYVIKQPKAWGWGVLVSGILLLFAVFAMITRLYVEENRPVAVVLSETAQVMSGPDRDYLVQYRLYSAAEIRILDEQNGWYKFMLPDGQRGWVYHDDVGIITIP